VSIALSHMIVHLSTSMTTQLLSRDSHSISGLFRH